MGVQQVLFWCWVFRWVSTLVSYISDALISKLEEFRNSSMDIEKFSEWFESNSIELKNLLSDGVFLKMKRGNAISMMDYLAKSSSSCGKCSVIHREGEFTDRIEFKSCNDKLISGGSFKRIKKPDWYKQSSKERAVSGFYECISCGAIWKLTAPEREGNGGWIRIA